MTNLKRTDIHRPSVLVPEDYNWAGFHTPVDAFNFEWVRVERERLAAHMKATGGKYATHAHGGSCHICGAWANSLVIFHHPETNEYIRTGEICAEKLDWSADAGFSAFKRNVENALAAKAGLAKAEAILGELDCTIAWETFAAWKAQELKWEDMSWEQRAVQDMVEKLVKYGSMSEKQEAFIKKLTYKIDHAEEIEAERKANEPEYSALPADVLDGRCTITGVVLATKWQESFYGDTLKMLVLDDRMFKVWGSVPSKIDAERGDRVEFDAKVEASDDDETFGFYSRPTKPAILEEGEVKISKKVAELKYSLEQLELTLEGIHHAKEIDSSVDQDGELVAKWQAKIDAAKAEISELSQ